MRHKIQDIIQGKFEYNKPVLIFQEDRLSLHVIEKNDYKGDFQFESSDKQFVRGFVTCSNPKVEVLTPEFSGNTVAIRFVFHGDQVLEGSEEQGSFIITSNVGEYKLDFTAKITRDYLPTSIGKIKTLNDFTNLCKLNWEEALHVFASPKFVNIFHENAQYYTLLYRGLTEQHCTSCELEEFLVAIEKKQRTFLEIAQSSLNYEVSRKTVTDTLDIAKSDWGFVEASISCDAAFVVPAKKVIKDYDFRGRHASLGIQIVPELMHAGRNYAVLTIENSFQKLEITICATLGDVIQEHSYNWKKRKIYYDLESAMLASELNEKTDSDWETESMEILQKAREEDPDHHWYALFLAYLYLEKGDIEQANEIMELMPRSIRNKNVRNPLDAFYLFLEAVVDPYIDPREVLAKIRGIYVKYPNHPILTWILLQIDESLNRNPQRKYQVAKQYLTNYGNSPIFFLEAGRILQQHPELLHGQDDFEMRLISWMAKHDMLTEELSIRIQGMAQTKRTFQKSFYKVLNKCFKLYETEGFVKTICTYLIKTGRYGETYFSWYKRGVEQHLKLAGLYEAYILSWSRAMGEMPVEIIKYFSMNSSLPSKKKAMLFAYVVRNKQRIGKDWDAYMVMVKNFAMKELELGHVNDDLAIIYEELRRIMTPKEWNRIKGEVEHCYKLYITGENMTTIHVLQAGDTLMKHRMPVLEKKGYVYLYHRPFVILYEDSNGHYHTSKNAIRMSKVLSGNSIYTPETLVAEDIQQEEVIPQMEPENTLDSMEGTIESLTEVLIQEKEKGNSVVSYAQQIMMRMLFTEHFPKQHDVIARLLMNETDSGDLMLAYVTILSRNILQQNMTAEESIYSYIGDRLQDNERLNDFCLAAFLKLHFTYQDIQYTQLAEQILKEYLFQGIYFDYYQLMPMEWKRKYLILDLSVISYYDHPGQKLQIAFDNGVKENLMESIAGVYTYPVRAFPGEILKYQILDMSGNVICPGKWKVSQADGSISDTKYMKLSKLSQGKTDTKVQYEYAQMCDMVNALFVPVKE